jgi:hypothetical protein
MKRLILVALISSFVACRSHGQVPTASSVLSSGAAIPATSQNTSAEPRPPVIPVGNGNLPAAVLEAALTATANPPSAGHYSYDLKLLVTETTGKSAAIVQAIVVKTPNGDTDMGCVPLGIRVAAGTTVDLIQRSGYCAPGTVGYFPGLKLSAAITYFDDAGASTTLTAFTTLD